MFDPHWLANNKKSPQVMEREKGKASRVVGIGRPAALIASHLSAAYHIDCGGPLETTAAADRVATLIAHQVFLLIDCMGAWRGCNKPKAPLPCSSSIASQPFYQCYFQDSDLCYLQPHPPLHTSAGHGRKQWGGVGLGLLRRMQKIAPL